MKDLKKKFTLIMLWLICLLCIEIHIAADNVYSIENINQCNDQWKTNFEERIGRVCDVKGEAQVHGVAATSIRGAEKYSIDNGCPLFKNDNITTITQDSALHLMFPSRAKSRAEFLVECKVAQDQKVVNIRTIHKTSINLETITKEGAESVLKNHIDQGTVHYRIKPDIKKLEPYGQINKNETLIIDTKRGVYIMVKASDFIVEETQKYTIVTTNENTRLDIRYRGKLYMLDELQKIIFQDDSDPLPPQKISKEQIDQMIQEFKLNTQLKEPDLPVIENEKNSHIAEASKVQKTIYDPKLIRIIPPTTNYQPVGVGAARSSLPPITLTPPRRDVTETPPAATTDANTSNKSDHHSQAVTETPPAANTDTSTPIKEDDPYKRD